MPNEIDRTSSAQRRSSKLLTAMAIFICLGIAAYMVLTLLVNRQTPRRPDTHYTGTNGVSVYYDSSVWSVCRMTEDATLGGTVLELATADTADSEDYQAVLLQRGTADSYEKLYRGLGSRPQAGLWCHQARKVNLTVDGAQQWKRCAVISAPTTPCWPPLPMTAAMWSMSRPDKAGVHQRCGQSGRKREPVMSDLRAMQRLCRFNAQRPYRTMK